MPLLRLGIPALALLMCCPLSLAQEQAPAWLLAHAHRIPAEYTNQESGYFSIVEGLNGRLYVGTAKYGVNCYLLEFDPVKAVFRVVVDVHRAIGKMLRGFKKEMRALDADKQAAGVAADDVKVEVREPEIDVTPKAPKA